MVLFDILCPASNIEGAWEGSRYHMVLVEQHMAVLIEVVGVKTTTKETMTPVNGFLAHSKDIAAMREKVVATSYEEYVACKFLLLENKGGVKRRSHTK